MTTTIEIFDHAYDALYDALRAAGFKVGARGDTLMLTDVALTRESGVITATYTRSNRTFTDAQGYFIVSYHGPRTGDKHADDLARFDREYPGYRVTRDILQRDPAATVRDDTVCNLCCQDGGQFYDELTGKVIADYGDTPMDWDTAVALRRQFLQEFPHAQFVED